MENRGLIETLYAALAYFITGAGWLMQETYQFFSWTAVVLATVLGAHGLVEMIKAHFRKRD